MKTFKDYAQDFDLDTFINLDEFADDHLINGTLLKCVIDDDIFDERSTLSGDRSGGVFKDMISIFIKKEDIEKPLIDEMITVDDEDYRVVEVKENMRMYEIELTRYDY